MKTYRFALLASALFALAPAGAQALTDTAACHERSAELEAFQAELEAQVVTRKTLVENTEKAGDAWEEAETMRNFGEAEKADTTQVEYEMLKSQLLSFDRKLQDDVRRLNADVAQYNAMCAPKKG